MFDNKCGSGTHRELWSSVKKPCHWALQCQYLRRSSGNFSVFSIARAAAACTWHRKRDSCSGAAKPAAWPAGPGQTGGSPHRGGQHSAPAHCSSCPRRHHCLCQGVCQACHLLLVSEASPNSDQLQKVLHNSMPSVKISYTLENIVQNLAVLCAVPVNSAERRSLRWRGMWCSRHPTRRISAPWPWTAQSS